MQINKILSKGNSLFSINHAYSFLFGMLGSMLIFTMFYIYAPRPQKIAVVNVTAIVREFVQKETKLNKSQDDVTKETKQFGVTLEKTLKQFSKENNLLLMPSEAVFAGSQDYTFIIKNKIQSIIQKHQAENDDQ